MYLVEHTIRVYSSQHEAIQTGALPNEMVINSEKLGNVIYLASGARKLAFTNTLRKREAWNLAWIQNHHSAENSSKQTSACFVNWTQLSNCNGFPPIEKFNRPHSDKNHLTFNINYQQLFWVKWFPFWGSNCNGECIIVATIPTRHKFGVYLRIFSHDNGIVYSELKNKPFNPINGGIESPFTSCNFSGIQGR